MSNHCIFGLYEWVYYRDYGSFPANKEKLGRVLGPLQNEGNEMAQAVLTSKGTAIPRHTLRKLNRAELYSKVEKRKHNVCDGIITSKLGSSIFSPAKPLPRDHVLYSDDIEPDLISLPDHNDPIDKNGVAVFENPITDQWIHTELHLPQGDELLPAKVIDRSKDADGNVVGTYDDNPMLNTLSYDVELSDGEVRKFSANVIANNM